MKHLTDMLVLLLEKSITERSMCESTNHFSLLNFIDFRAQRWALYYWGILVRLVMCVMLGHRKLKIERDSGSWTADKYSSSIF